MALTVGVATVLDSREVVIVVTGLRKALALSKAIGKTLPLHRIALINTCLEEGVNHLVSIILLFPPPNRTNPLHLKIFSGRFLLSSCIPVRL